MNIKSLIIMFIILLSLGGFYFYEVTKEKKQKTIEEKQKKVFNLNVSEVTAIEIQFQNKENLRIERNKSWKITKPVQTKVDTVELERYLSTIDKAHFSRVIKETVEDLDEFGLSEPSTQIVIEFGTLKEKLIIGSPAPVGFAYYARKEGGTNIFLLEDHIVKDLSKDLFTLRYKRLTELKPQDIEEIHIRVPSFEITAKRREGVWHSEEKIDSSKLETLLGRIVWTQAIGVHKESLDAVSEGEFQSPTFSIGIKAGENQDEIKIKVNLKEEPKKVYATSDSMPHVFLMPEWLSDYIPKEMKDLLMADERA